MNNFTITQHDDTYILRVHGRYICRCDSYDDAIRAYEDYLMMAEARQQRRTMK